MYEKCPFIATTYLIVCISCSIVCKIIFCLEFPHISEKSQRRKETNSKRITKCYALLANAITDTIEVSVSFYENIISAELICKEYFKLSYYFQFHVTPLTVVALPFLTDAGSKTTRTKPSVTCSGILT